MPEAHDTRGARRRAALAAEQRNDGGAKKELTIDDLPHDQIVSIFMAIDDPIWVRHNVPCVCKEWNELFHSKGASPLHETLEIDLEKEETAAKETRARLGPRPSPGPAAQKRPRLKPVVNGSRVVAWAQRHASSVRKLRLTAGFGGYYVDFSPEDLGAVVAAVAPSLTEIWIDVELSEVLQEPFWRALQHSVVPAGRLRSFVANEVYHNVFHYALKPLRDLAGSLEELELSCLCNEDYMPSFALATDSDDDDDDNEEMPLFFSHTELRRLALHGHFELTAAPALAKISSLKKLEDLQLGNNITSLPKELGELSGLTRLDLSENGRLGSPWTSRPAGETIFPAELGKLQSLRELNLSRCGIRAIPAFVGELASLEVLDLGRTDLRIDAPLDFLLEACPRLREVTMNKPTWGKPWTPEELARLEDFKAKLLAKNPDAKVAHWEF